VAALPGPDSGASDSFWASGLSIAPGQAHNIARLGTGGEQLLRQIVWHDPCGAGFGETWPGPAGNASESSIGPLEEDGPGSGPLLADLVAGILPFDAGALERGAEQFFAHLQALGQDPAAAPLARRLMPWLATGALAAAAAELSRRRRKASTSSGPALVAD
jgi:hypothetical protein